MKDTHYLESAPNSLYNLVEATGSTSLTEEYLQMYDHTYEDGRESMIGLIGQVNDYGQQSPVTKLRVLKKLANGLIPTRIGGYSCDELLNEDLLELAYTENIDYAENQDMGLFFKKIIASVYIDGVEEISPVPSPENNYLWSEESKAFAGEFSDGARRFSFQIVEKPQGSGEWSIGYKLLELLEEDGSVN